MAIVADASGRQQILAVAAVDLIKPLPLPMIVSSIREAQLSSAFNDTETSTVE